MPPPAGNTSHVAILWFHVERRRHRWSAAVRARAPGRRGRGDPADAQQVGFSRRCARGDRLAAGQSGRPVAAGERVAQRQSRAPDLVVVEPLSEWTCTGCGGSGSLLFMEDDGPLCLGCADLDHLVFLPAGDAALSRRAKQASRLSAVVVRFSRSRKRYERQGILVEEAALEQAEAQCLADEDARARRRERDRQRRADQDLTFQVRLAEAVARLFPGCPAERAEAIACHASVRGSGRVGRSAAGQALDEQAVTLAVVASVRHHDTGYDELLMTGVPREEARARVRPAIDRVLAAWQHP